jgi:RNA-binding protein YhbY
MIGIGKHKRTLRAISNRMKSTQQLPLLYCKDITEGFLINLNDLIKCKELVQIKMNVDKKKEAKEIGIRLALETNSIVAQVVGHSILLYKESNPPGDVSKALAAMELQDGGDDDSDDT